MRFLWPIFGAPVVKAKTVIGTGSHSWDAIFHCDARSSCAEEVYTYDVERLPADRGLRWKCACGRIKALSPEQVSDMQRQIKADAEQTL